MNQYSTKFTDTLRKKLLNSESFLEYRFAKQRNIF